MTRSTLLLLAGLAGFVVTALVLITRHFNGDAGELFGPLEGLNGDHGQAAARPRVAAETSSE